MKIFLKTFLEIWYAILVFNLDPYMEDSNFNRCPEITMKKYLSIHKFFIVMPVILFHLNVMELDTKYIYQM